MNPPTIVLNVVQNNFVQNNIMNGNQFLNSQAVAADGGRRIEELHENNESPTSAEERPGDEYYIAHIKEMLGNSN
jgi:hypothetical protein